MAWHDNDWLAFCAGVAVMAVGLGFVGVFLVCGTVAGYVASAAAVLRQGALEQARRGELGK